MATNVQGTRTTNRTDEVPGAERDVTTVGTPGNVAVYDNDVDRTTDPALRTTPSGMDRVPVETRSSGSIMSWIIGAIVLIVIAYFLLQFIF